MKFGSLFAGIGGIDLGLERAGMTCAWQVEIDDYCNKILEKHWPDVPRYRDVKDVGRNLEPVDLIAGGFPCQPHSIAGKRKGATDDRNLWPEYFRVIKELKPRYVLAENVPGIISTYIDTVLFDLESEAYTCTTFNIPACAFDAPHRRERIFIMADANRTRELQPQGGKRTQRRRTSDESQDVPNPAPLLGSEIKRDEQDGVLSEVLADTQNTNRRGTGGTQNQRWRYPEAGRCGFSGDRETYWTVEPNMGRVAHGVPSRVDRLRSLGNAVVPQVAEWIGRRIMEYDNSFS